ncbi:MAG: hypothetical protein M5U22_01690 [Thermoleophilia bacterium]|nr:hypothetical protein [Thermoleophilia bacterium]
MPRPRDILLQIHQQAEKIADGLLLQGEGTQIEVSFGPTNHDQIEGVPAVGLTLTPARYQGAMTWEETPRLASCLCSL